MKNKLRWDHLTSPEIKAAAQGEAIVILPVGSVEQHGPHLPVGCDAILAQAMSERIAARLDERGIPVVVAPTLTVANSVHHMAFAGTITLQPGTFILLLAEQCRCIAAHGFRKMVLMNGHGGNFAPMDTALITINAQLGFPVFSMGYWEGAPDIQKQVLESQESMNHACESETSIMLAIDESLVDPCYRQTQGPMAHPTRAEDAGMVSTFRRMEEMTENGVMGNSHLATREKGQRMVEAMVQGAADVLAGLW